MKRAVIGFVGMPGAGKSTAISVAAELGPVVTMGDVVRAELSTRGLANTPENLGQVARELRDQYGPMVIAEKCTEIIKNLEEEVVIVDGIRSMAEVRLFKEAFGDFPVIAVIATDENRHRWLIARGRADDSTDMVKIQERDAREIGFGVREVIDSAKYHILNTGTAAELQEKTRAVLEAILSKK